MFRQHRHGSTISVMMKCAAISISAILLWFSMAEGSDISEVCMAETAVCVQGEDYSSKTPYPTPKSDDIKDRIPSGCHLQGWTYLGRHASRYATRSKTCDNTETILQDSNIINWVCPSVNKYGHITALGAREAHDLGSRFKEFKSGKILKVTTTAKLRTQQTANQFLFGFGEDPASYDLSFVPLKQDNRLRFFDTCSKYVRDHSTDMPVEVDKSRETILTPIANKISKIIGKEVSGKEAETLFQECFYKWIGEDVDKRRPIDRKLCELFSNDDIDLISFRKDLKEYYKKGPGSEVFNGTKISCGLMGDIIKDLKTVDDGDITLRFAHAETLVPIYSLLNVGTNAAPPMSDWSAKQIENREWKLSKICPMASNVAFLKLSCPSISASPQILFLLDEKQHDWSLPTCHGKLCPLDEFEAAFPENNCNWKGMCDLP